MKKILFCFCILFLSAFYAGADALPVAPFLPATDDKKDWKAPITVQYPTEKMQVPSGAEQIYLFGKLNLKEPTLQINGQEIPVYHNGTFITYLPVQTGTFEFVLTAISQGKTYQATRHIIVPGKPLEDLKDKARFDESRVFPRKAVWVLPGEKIVLSARGTPGAQVTAEFPGFKNSAKITLSENKNVPGLYQKEYTFSKQAKPDSSKIVYRLYDPRTKTKAKATGKHSIKILDAKKQQPGKITDPGVKIRQLPVHQGSLYPYYRAYGQVLIDGRENGLYRLRLSENEYAWLEESKVKLTDDDDFKPNTLLQLRTISDEKSTRITWSGQTQVPLSIHEFSDRLEVMFYYTDAFEENFDFDATSPILDHIAWEDPRDGVVKFTLFFKPEQTLWGHSYQYDEDNNLTVTLRHPPVLTPRKNKPLAGARILIDAGHSPKRKPPYDGLVSPSGFLEYEANLALAMVLKPKLQSAGATVIMTREKDNEMSLPDRYQKALDEDAHILVSLHHNALPETVDPLAKPLGYSVYYMYPHSFKLAESLHNAFHKYIDLPDSGLIANDVLFIPRIPDIPSVLIESAYMILPQQEELVVSKEGRERFAQTIYEGILDFYGAAHKVYMNAVNTDSK